MSMKQKKLNVAELYNIFAELHNSRKGMGFNMISFTDPIGGANFTLVHEKNKDELHYDNVYASFEALVTLINQFYDAQ